MIKRSIFVRTNRLFGVAGTLLCMAAGLAQEIVLPEKVKPSMSILEMMHKRMSTRAFSPQDVAMEKLSFVLHALHRVPVAMEKRGAVLVVLKKDVYFYDGERHTLIRSTAEPPELRMPDAPVSLYLTPRPGQEVGDDLWIWRGMAGQAIYLVAAALDLGTVTVGGIGFPLGNPVQSVEWTPAPAFDKSNLPPLPDATGLPALPAVLSGKETPLDFKESEKIPFLLWVLYGNSQVQDSKKRVHKTVPSARGRYPMTLHYFQDGMQRRYIPDEHGFLDECGDHLQSSLFSLFGESSRQMGNHILLTWDANKLPSRGYAFYETGAMAYNLWLVEKLTGYASNPYPIHASDHESIRTGFHLEAHETPLMFFELKPLTPAKSGSPAYKDGVYTGEWKEWPEMKVEVTVKGGKISGIKVLEDFGTPEFSAKVKEMLPGLMIEKGSTDVESITSATLSSNSLKKAVNAALEKAR